MPRCCEASSLPSRSFFAQTNRPRSAYYLQKESEFTTIFTITIEVVYKAPKEASVKKSLRTKEVNGFVIHEKPYRSIVKAISWRITGTLDTIVVSLIITGKMKVALSIGAVEIFTKIIWYYGHERLWNRIGFGRVKIQRHEYDI
jgi:uncharacterized membrane protein